MNQLLLPTSYLPPLSYVALLLDCPCATIEIHETYPKQTHRNRCEIMTANGIMRLSVPVVRTSGNHTPTSDITISYAERWNIQHIRAIESAYSMTPYFLYLWDDLKAILLRRHYRLIDLNSEIMRYLFTKLNISCQLQYSEDYVSPQQAASNQLLDMRNMFAHNPSNEANPLTQLSHKSESNDSERRQLYYIESNTELAQVLPSRRDNDSERRHSSIQAFKQLKYYQLWADRLGFCPNLSIIDLLFNIGPAESRKYLSKLKADA